MKAKDYRDKSIDDLLKEVSALKEELFKLRFQHATNQLENTSQLRLIKRDLARVQTIIRERELVAAKK